MKAFAGSIDSPPISFAMAHLFAPDGGTYLRLLLGADVGWLDFTVVFTQESFGVIREESETGRTDPHLPTDGKYGALSSSISIEKPTASLDEFELRDVGHRPRVRLVLANASLTGTAGDNIAVQRNRAIPRQRPAFQVHAGG